MKEIVCRRCGEIIQITRDLDSYGRLRTFRLNPDGSPHYCEVKIKIPDHILKWARETYNINELERCSARWRIKEDYRKKLHKLRHSYKVAQHILKELRSTLDYHRWRLKLIEKLLKIQWNKIWSVGTHNYHYKAVDNFFKWYKDYYETVYPQTTTATEALSRVLDWFYNYDEGWKRTRVIGPLALFNDQLDEILHIIRLVRDVAVSNAVKREKNYWLRQITQATEWPSYSWIGYGKQLMWYDETVETRTLLLDYEKAIKKTEKRFQEAYKDRLAEITGKEDHGYFIDGMFNYRTEN